MANKGRRFFSGYRFLAIILIPVLAAVGVFCGAALGVV